MAGRSRLEPDTPYAIAAGNLLHPASPAASALRHHRALARRLDDLAPAAQLDLLRRGAATGADGKLLYGVALQRLGRQLSAVREFDAAAKEAPDDVEAQVAAAVGRFDKARPAEAFSRLGPLTRRFPNRATVRFHLGLMLLWAGEVKEANTARARHPGGAGDAPRPRGGALPGRAPEGRGLTRWPNL